MSRDWHSQLPKPAVPKQPAASGCMGNHEPSPGELASCASHLENRGVTRLSSTFMQTMYLGGGGLGNADVPVDALSSKASTSSGVVGMRILAILHCNRVMLSFNLLININLPIWAGLAGGTGASASAVQA